jgi:hypothetical protein
MEQVSLWLIAASGAYETLLPSVLPVSVSGVAIFFLQPAIAGVCALGVLLVLNRFRRS